MVAASRPVCVYVCLYLLSGVCVAVEFLPSSSSSSSTLRSLPSMLDATSLLSGLTQQPIATTSPPTAPSPTRPPSSPTAR